MNSSRAQADFCRIAKLCLKILTRYRLRKTTAYKNIRSLQSALVDTDLRVFRGPRISRFSLLSKPKLCLYGAFYFETSRFSTSHLFPFTASPFERLNNFN